MERTALLRVRILGVVIALLACGEPALARSSPAAGPQLSSRPRTAERALPATVTEASLNPAPRRDVVQIRFDAEPTVRATSDPRSRRVILDFGNARLPDHAPLLPQGIGLVESLSLAAKSPRQLRLEIQVRPGTRASVYRRHGEACYLVMIEPDSRPGGRGAASLTWPVRGRLSSSYGWRMHPILHEGRMHQGIDIAVPCGTPIRAVAAGKVLRAERRDAAGLCVVIEHPGGVRTTYMHCSRLLVRQGDRVARRQQVAEAGDTGLATGSHLHFGVSADGHSLDPVRFLKGGP